MHTIRRPRNPQLQHTQQELLEQFTVPLELKTGKMGHPLGSVDHRAQVTHHISLYNIMMVVCVGHVICIDVIRALRWGNPWGSVILPQSWSHGGRACF